MKIPSKQAVATLVVLSEIVERAIAVSSSDELTHMQLSAIANQCLFEYYKDHTDVQLSSEIYTGMDFPTILENAIVAYMAMGCIPTRIAHPGTLLLDKIDMLSFQNGTIQADEDPKEAVRRWVKEIYEDQSVVFETIATTASAMGKKIKSTNATLLTIQQEVSKLVDEIHQRIAEEQSDLPNCALLNRLDVGPSEYPEFSLRDTLGALGGVETIRSVCGTLVGVTEEDDLKRAFLKVGTRMLPRLGDVPDIPKPSAEEQQKIITELTTTYKELSADAIKQVFTVMYSKSSLNVIGKKIARYMEELVTFDRITELKTFVDTYWLVVHYLNASTYKNKASDYLQSLLYMAGYFLAYVNEVTLADIYLINNTFINTNLKQKAREQNITNDTIFKYLFIAEVNQQPLTGLGTSLSTLKTAKDTIAEQWSDLHHSILVKATFELRNLKLKVVRTMVLRYLEVDNYDVEEAAKYIDNIKKMERALDYVVYDAIMAARYPKTALIRELYESLGIAYTRILEQFPDKIDVYKDSATVSGIAAAVMRRTCAAFLSKDSVKM